MQIGVDIFVTDTSIRPVPLARALEERGFHSVFLAEHSHIPTARASAWPGGDVLPDRYYRTLDVFMTLAMMAAVTERLRLGTGITLVAQHDPIWLAKQVATLDLVSDGRMDFGIGFGWNREEMEHHAVDFSKRREIVREQLGLMKELWTKDEASYSGEHVDLAPSAAWPKPVQRPHPPIIVGAGLGPKTLDLIAEHCSGWMPIDGRNDLTEGVERFRTEMAARDRNPDDFQYIVYSSKPNPAKWDAWEEAGITQVLLHLPSESEASVVALLDEYEPLLNR